jgi:homoserine dehydrogenase
MKIGLLGCGTVGGGVLDIVEKRSDMEIKYVLVRRPRPELGALAVSDVDVILNDPEVDTVVEVLGGLSPSFEYVAAALKAGKNVVTANKHLVAHHYKELIALAKENGAAFRCTPAVGGGIPWLVNLERVARVNPVKEFWGIMNGTTNFILDAMHKNGADFSAVLAQAQALGYAEADPSADIDGLDIQRKCIITANVAFGAMLSEEDVPVAGIRNVKACDIAAAEAHGRVCRILGCGKKTEKGVAAYVEPVFAAAGSLEAAVDKNFNMISFDTEYTGRESFYGQGAGRYPTAYNAVEDCVDILEGVKSFYTDKMEPVSPDNSAEAHPYYVRTSAKSAGLDAAKSESWGEGVLTKPLSVKEAHDMAALLLKSDPGFFMAGIKD